MPNRFCCKCGKSESEEPIVQGFCLSCYAKEFPLVLKIPEKGLQLTTCKLCGDLAYHSKWKEVEDDSTSIIDDFLREYLEKVKTVSSTKVIAISNIEEPPFGVASKQEVVIIFEGSPNEEVPAYQQEIVLPIKINAGVCERCGKFTGGYYESIVQIRSDQRKIKEKEQMFISQIIEQKRNQSLKDNRMAYISKTVDQIRGGIDLYIGDKNFAKNLASEIASHFAASIEYSTKLKSVKDGKPIYYTTYCVRLPNFEIGDLVRYQKGLFQIQMINNGRATLYNLRTKESKTLSQKDSTPEKIELYKKKKNLQKYIIMSLQKTTVSLMNLQTYETINVPRSSLVDDHEEGQETLLIELSDGYFECPI
ncbi:hypothetical protein EU523_01115 [Candidatus Heimdallarchaeota archaeon]|nr:MAG: hypothetical protein EU523_01115 [Candidatus Heimdallarchaeota archaeon]